MNLWCALVVATAALQSTLLAEREPAGPSSQPAATSASLIGTTIPASDEPPIVQTQQESVSSRQSSTLGNSARFGRFTAPGATRRAEVQRPGASYVDGKEALIRPSTDAGNLLGNSPNARGVARQQRTPIVTDIRIRGTHTGQLQASGSYWVPARLDLDTMLSKIDSGIVRDIITIDGPFSVLYGPGFSFVDTEIEAAGRFDSGLGWSGRTLTNFNTNGEQLYGRQVLSVGSTNWGLRFGYGHRTGNDYRSGGGALIPASFNSRDVDVAMSYDLSEHSRIDFNFLRLDQTDVEFAGQIFDINFLVTDGYEVQYTNEGLCWADSFVAETWYNRTRFEGDAQRSSKRRQIPELDAMNFYGFTDVDSTSTGYRAMFVLGDQENSQLNFGTDLRYVRQELNEYDIGDAQFGSGLQQNFPIPKSHTSNPGIFAEAYFPVTCALNARVGTRVDWVSTNIDKIPDGRSAADLAAFLGDSDFDEHFSLWSYYLALDYQLTESLILTAGGGYGMRAPMLTELYAIDPFLAILQQGFTQVRGNLDLRAARMYQIDLGMQYESEYLSAGVGVFHSWVVDYITYEARSILPGTNGEGLGVTYVNTDLATLGGFDAYLEYHCSDWFTPFARMDFVEGRDHTRGSGFQSSDSGVIPRGDEEPLPSISPLDTLVGIRLHDSSEDQCWGIEGVARIVNNQDRVALSLGERQSAGFTTYSVRSFWRPNENLIFTGGIENFTDKDYREHLDLLTGLGVRQPGISYYVGAEWFF